MIKPRIIKKQVNIAVFGGGSWATAIVKMLTKNVKTIGWYMRNSSAIEDIKRDNHNPNYLTSVEFKKRQLFLSDDIDKMAKYADIIILAIPSAFVNAELSKITTSLEDKVIFSAIKGIVPESGLIVGQHLNQKYNVPLANIGVISGPCHAEEVALERLSYLTIACLNEKNAQDLSKLLSSSFIYCKTSDDIIGTEYAAMLKNIYAIAAGIAHGLGYGDNYQSVLMSNAVREMKRYIETIHKMERNINDSAYLGDLLVTGYSVFSRNRMFGTMIGKGYTVKSAMMEMQMVAEGYYALQYANNINTKREVIAPIINAVYNVVYEGKSPKKQFKTLSEKLD